MSPPLSSGDRGRVFFGKNAGFETRPAGCGAWLECEAAKRAGVFRLCSHNSPLTRGVVSLCKEAFTDKEAISTGGSGGADGTRCVGTKTGTLLRHRLRRGLGEKPGVSPFSYAERGQSFSTKMPPKPGRPVMLENASTWLMVVVLAASCAGVKSKTPPVMLATSPLAPQAGFDSP